MNEDNLKILTDKGQNSNCLNGEPKLDFNKECKEVEEIRSIYSKNLDDESTLFNYLNILNKFKHTKKFKSELLLYFVALSAEIGIYLPV